MWQPIETAPKDYGRELLLVVAATFPIEKSPPRARGIFLGWPHRPYARRQDQPTRESPARRALPTRAARHHPGVLSQTHGRPVRLILRGGRYADVAQMGRLPWLALVWAR